MPETSPRTDVLPTDSRAFDALFSTTKEKERGRAMIDFRGVHQQPHLNSSYIRNHRAFPNIRI